MTSAHWLAATDPDPLVASARLTNLHGFERRTRLFGCACARQVWHLLPTDPRSAVQVSERLAEGEASDTDLLAAAVALQNLPATPLQNAINAAGWASGAFYWSARPPGAAQSLLFQPVEAARYAARALASEAVGPAPQLSRVPETWHTDWTRVYDDVRAAQAGFARDIFPPPNYTPYLESEWRTSTVLSLAWQIHDSGEFFNVPILADALQDAGCDDDAVLECCRVRADVHVRGNWVVDLVLGRG